MFKTCSRCGIVDINHVCPYKPKKKVATTATEIRATSRWHKKSVAIRERDKYLCRMCLLERYGTLYKYNTNDLGVHHIIPLEEAPDKAYDDDNLITLCDHHHKLAEKNEIPRQELIEIVIKDIRYNPPYI